MSLLTSRQADELHKSIIAYLTANRLIATAAALRTELNLGENEFDPATAEKYQGLLEKKWTSVVRLQKKIMDLESRNAALQSELDNATPVSLSTRNKDPSSWLPDPLPRYTLESHRSTINCITFHPIFSALATGSDDYTIKIWDWDAGELERTIKGHTRAVLDVEYGGPRGSTLLASCSSDLTIKLWDPANDYKNIRTLPGHDHSVSALRFIPGSTNLLVSASRDQTLKIWDVITGFCLKTLKGHTGWVRDVFPSFDGRYLLSCGDDMTARLWDISSTTQPESKITMFGHEHHIECCAIAPPAAYKYIALAAGLKKPPPTSSSAEYMATGSRDKTIRLWDARGTCILSLVGHDNWIRALVFYPGGKYLLSVSDDRSLRCWDLNQDGRCVKVIRELHEGFITSLQWAPSIVRNAEHAERLQDEEVTSKIVPYATSKDGIARDKPGDVHVRCVIATAGVDCKLRIFTN
ncbi:nuclear distribution protein pac-1a [Xylaria arbuscula]|nr:nuclear distribution protein pac-1a [Xylaria arbuscula]